MPKLKVMSAKEVVKILESFGFEVVGQRGSHIYNQASKFVSETELVKYFYK